MTSIQNMTKTQRNSWLVLLADGAVFAWFWQKMTVGLSPAPVIREMDEFGGIVLGIIILTIALHIVISVIFELSHKKSDAGKDERDIAIERRGAFWGYRILQIGLGIVIVGMLLSGGFGMDYQAPIRFSNPVEIIFGLIVTSYVADLTKHAVMLYGYGR